MVSTEFEKGYKTSVALPKHEKNRLKNGGGAGQSGYTPVKLYFIDRRRPNYELKWRVIFIFRRPTLFHFITYTYVTERQNFLK